jgi:magnesium chelatase family protein
MLASVLSATLQGIEGKVIRVEVDVAPGLPGFTIVGLPDASLQEARERVRGGIRNSGLVFPPRRITVNLAPADLRKTGASLDAAIAVGILLGSEQARADGSWALIGELSLGGELRRVPGILSMVAALARRGVARVVVPEEAAAEAGLVERIEVHAAADLAAAVAAIRSGRAAPARSNPARVDLGGTNATRPAADAQAGVGATPGPAEVPDLADVRGQAVARRALEIALAGGHGLLLVGPPGSGKTLLARTIPGLLPPLDRADALTATAIRSAAGEGPITELDRRRPFRSPHHTISYAGMVGGGPILAPGEVTRAHQGVLFLDELPEFGRDVLEALRQPLEEGRVAIVRAARSMILPARFQLVAAMNPCPCRHGLHRGTCTRRPLGSTSYHRQRSRRGSRSGRPGAGRFPVAPRSATRRPDGREPPRADPCPPRASPALLSQPRLPGEPRGRTVRSRSARAPASGQHPPPDPSRPG